MTRCLRPSRHKTPRARASDRSSVHDPCIHDPVLTSFQLSHPLFKEGKLEWVLPPACTRKYRARASVGSRRSDCSSPAWKAGCSEQEGADRGSPDIRTGARASHQAFDIFPSPAHLISPLPPIYLLLVAEQRRNGDVPFQAGYRSGRSAATVLPTLST